MYLRHDVDARGGGERSPHPLGDKWTERRRQRPTPGVGHRCPRRCDLPRCRQPRRSILRRHRTLADDPSQRDRPHAQRDQSRPGLVDHPDFAKLLGRRRRRLRRRQPGHAPRLLGTGRLGQPGAERDRGASGDGVVGDARLGAPARYLYRPGRAGRRRWRRRPQCSRHLHRSPSFGRSGLTRLKTPDHLDANAHRHRGRRRRFTREPPRAGSPSGR